MSLTGLSRRERHSGPVVECTSSSAERWVAVRQHGRLLALVGEARKTIELGEGGPFDCGIEAFTRCGADLDRDGVNDAVVRVEWEERHAETSGDETEVATAVRCHIRRFVGSSVPYTSTFVLLSAGGCSPIGRVLLLADETGAGREGHTEAAEQVPSQVTPQAPQFSRSGCTVAQRPSHSIRERRPHQCGS